MPGIDTSAPLRTERNNGFEVSPNFLPAISSNYARFVQTWSKTYFGVYWLFLKNKSATKVTIVNPGGIFRPILAISARLA